MLPAQCIAAHEMTAMTHIHRFHVFFGDCDDAGIVFYPRFFNWFDNAFCDWTRTLGLGQRAMRRRFGVHATPIVDAGASFRAPARCDDLLAIEARAIEWGRSSFRVAYRASRDDTPVAEGFEVRVFVAQDAQGRFEPVSVPPEFREALS